MQAAVKSRRHPFSNMTRRNLQLAYLAQLTVKYDLQDELMLTGNSSRQRLKRHEVEYPGCKFSTPLLVF